ncbi:LPS-assembly lipoprotein [Pasteurella testudinis DSM 23072]|uniref:LPS-assembly lipoprotein LptE n=1 Tax=Pasteurella testudinis DSM 23072 TaxID=1122938 RepID=A0A1W1USD3_9PAST|nr:LPS assembly lipoprotein LptE [Pasteurella testudinis]SMB83731.1 LPS-assembly lipoprotein [Pasteurella testudinis DSM 23072]SUB50990.1 putative lipopolysccharide assembly LptE protein [Pasteurella testudinis]
MLKKAYTLLLCVTALLLSGCGFHFANQGGIDPAFQTMKLQSTNPYDYLSREVRDQLRAHQVTIVEQGDVPELRIKNSTIGSSVVSVFKQGREAEKLLTLNLTAAMYVPGRGEFPLSVRNTRTFFDDSRAALAKSAEQDVIYNDMRTQAARQLMIKIISLQNQLAAK